MKRIGGREGKRRGELSRGRKERIRNGREEEKTKIFGREGETEGRKEEMMERAKRGREGGE